MPKTYNALYEQICEFNNLYLAYLKARQCKRYRREVLLFSRNVEEELLVLQEELLTGAYKTGKYFRFTIYEPKRREISALPFRDRIVHHAICNIIERLFENKFIKDSYACRRLKGSHAGSARLTEFLRRSRRMWGKVYCLQADVSKFFPSVDHDAMKSIIRKTIRCEKTLTLLDAIIDSVETERGMPIGNLTSQIFANVYLNELDHFVKEKLQARFFIRYMDDFLILHHEKSQLHFWKMEISSFMKRVLNLDLNPKTAIYPVNQGVDFLGYRTWATHKLLRKRNILNMKRKLRRLAGLYQKNLTNLESITPVIASWRGHAKHANSHNVVSRVLRSVSFSRNSVLSTVVYHDE